MTLTYPREYPEDPEVCKNHLKALRKRLQRKYWRLRCLLEAGHTAERSLALSSAPVRGTVFRTDRQATPLHLVFLV